MPYGSTQELPDNVKKLYSLRCLAVFRRVFNDTINDGKSEKEAFQNAHAAAKNCMANT